MIVDFLWWVPCFVINVFVITNNMYVNFVFWLFDDLLNFAYQRCSCLCSVLRSKYLIHKCSATDLRTRGYIICIFFC